MNAAKLKLNAPFAHTPFEVIRKRWGTAGHCVILFFALATNIIVCSLESDEAPDSSARRSPQCSSSAEALP
jgi:hypothetical protein